MTARKAASSLLFFIVFAFCMLSFQGRVLAGDLAIEAIRYGQHAGKTRLVMDVNQKTDFRAFLLDNPARLVVDVPRSHFRVPRGKGVSDDVIKSYRSGDLEDGLSRIVFDLKRPALVKSAFVLPRDGFSKDRIVIDLAPVSKNLFAAAQEDVFGTLQVTGIKAPAKATSAHRAQENKQVALAAPVMLPVRKPEKFNRAKPAARKVVIVDAGHGGHDPGAVEGHVHEKMITLSTARMLRQALEETGRYKVYLTRDSDKFIGLRERVAYARKKNADLFISLHADKIGRKNVRGASIYTLSEKASDAETERLADAENKAGIVSGVDLSNETAEVADILLDLAMREKMNESNLLARYIGDGFRRKNIRLLPNSHRSAGFAVLKAPDVPSVLLEIGFLSNPDEAKLLNSKDFQAKIAQAILEGVDAYFRKIAALQKI